MDFSKFDVVYVVWILSFIIYYCIIIIVSILVVCLSMSACVLMEEQFFDHGDGTMARMASTVGDENPLVDKQRVEFFQCTLLQ